MPEILVRGLDQKTVKRLKERARISGRSLQQEVKDILERAATTLTMEEAHRSSQTWHRRLAGRSGVPIACHAAGCWPESAVDIGVRRGVTVYAGRSLARAARSGCRVVTADRRL